MTITIHRLAVLAAVCALLAVALVLALSSGAPSPAEGAGAVDSQAPWAGVTYW